MRPFLVRALLLALALLAAPALAQSGPTPAAAPAGAHTLAVGNATLAYWVGSADAVDEDLALGEAASIWFHLAGVNGTRRVAYLNVTPAADTLAIPAGALVLDAANASARGNVSYQTTVADAGRVDQAYAFAGELYEERNGTLALVGPISGSGAFVVDVGALVVPAPVDRTPYIVGGVAALVVLGGVGAYMGRQRAVKRRMNEGPRRSQVMRDLELEKKLEKAKEPEQVREIQQEIRQAEQVREKRRELQILEAKRADALKTIDLLRKRHESGGLTKLQFDNMVAKKQADLARIEAEIAQMEREDRGAAA